MTTCQAALDESTKREIEQLQMVMELKYAIEKRKQEREGEKGAKPEKESNNLLEAYRMENELLKE